MKLACMLLQEVATFASQCNSQTGIYLKDLQWGREYQEPAHILPKPEKEEWVYMKWHASEKRKEETRKKMIKDSNLSRSTAGHSSSHKAMKKDKTVKMALEITLVSLH